MKNFSIKRFTASLLFIVMVVAALPVSLFNFTISAETVLDAAIFCSDLHGETANLTSILGQIKSSGVTYSSIGLVGDTCLTVSSVTSSISSALGYTPKVMFSYASSHDTEGGADIADDWDYSGEVEGVSKYYLVYTIRETDMQNSSGASTAAPAFTSWYNGLTDAQKKLPIFIMSHRPLHDRRDDNAGAATWYSAISAAAETSDIVFFWGHNHTGDNSVDQAAYYVAKDGTETFTVYNGDTVVPNFTYMNAGYIDANGQNPARKPVATTVQITASELIFQDYTTSGTYTNSSYSHNVTVAREFAATKEAVSIEITSGTRYIVGGNGFEVTATYDDGTTANVTEDCTITGCDLTASGKYTVTATYGELTDTIDVTVSVYDEVLAYDGETLLIAVEAVSQGATALEVVWDDAADAVLNAEGVYTDYVVYDLALTNPGESTMYSMSLSDNMDITNLAVYHVADDGTLTLVPHTIENDCVVFTTSLTGAFAYGSIAVPAGYTLSSITLAGIPKDLFAGDGLDLTNAVITATYTKEGAEDYVRQLTVYDWDESNWSNYDVNTVGSQTAVFTFEGKTATLDICVWGDTFTKSDVTVVLDTENGNEYGVTGITVAESTNAYVSTAISGVITGTNYDAYDISLNFAEGYTGINAPKTVTLPIPEGVTNPAVYYVSDNGSIVVYMDAENNGDGTVSFTTTHFSTYVVGEATEITVPGNETATGNNTVTSTTEKEVYVLVSSISGAGDYLIVNTNSATNSAHLLTATSNGVTDTSGVTVVSGTDSAGATVIYIEDPAAAAIWTATANGSGYRLYNSSTQRYLRRNSSSLTVTSDSNYSTSWRTNTNAIYYDGNTDRYIRYSNGWSSLNSGSGTVYVYQKQTVEIETSTTVSGTYSIDGEDKTVAAIKGATVDLESTLIFTPTSGDDTTEDVSATATYEVYKTDSVNGDPLGVISGINGNVVTLSGNPGKALVKVTYTTDFGVVTDYITVEATTPDHYSVQLYKHDGSKPTEEITEPVALKGVKAGDTYSIWAVVKAYATADDTTGTNLGDLGDALHWTVSDTSIATIDTDTGVITFTGNNYGTFTVTVAYEGADGKPITDTVTISVTESQYVVPGDGTNDFPEYPNEGAVRFDKTATAVGNFSETGITKVELSMTGVPYSTGSEIDVVLMLDMTGSMSDTAMEAAEEAAVAFVAQIVKNEDGTYNKNRIAVYAFNSGSSSPYELVALGTIGSDTELETANTAIRTASTKQASGGTPYDEALEKCQSVLKEAKTTNLPEGVESAEDYERQQFCVFMSDGGPTSYQYITNYDAVKAGTATEYTTSSASATGGANQSDSNFATIAGYTHEYYSTLMKDDGVTMFSVLTGLSKASYPNCATILENIASSSDNAYVVESGSDTSAVTNALSSIAQKIVEAAKDVVVEDKIGNSYSMNFSLPGYGTDYALGADTLDGLSEFYIQVVEYQLDANKERTGDPTVLENFTFNQDGTLKSHTVGGVACSGCSHVTVTNGVITAIDGTYFDYERKTEVENGKTIDAEYLTWTADKLTTTELALQYFAWLDNSSGVPENQQVPADTYYTNEYATLTYTNYQGNRVQQEMPVPQMTWNGAQVSYVFYLVNEQGQPVNRAGKVVPFAEAIYVTDIFTKEVIWNDLEQLASLDAAFLAGELVPDVYELYDDDATYFIHVYEDENKVNLNNHFVIGGDISDDTDRTNAGTTIVFNSKADNNRYYAVGTYVADDGDNTSGESKLSYLCKGDGTISDVTFTEDRNASTETFANNVYYTLENGIYKRALHYKEGNTYYKLIAATYTPITGETQVLASDMESKTGGTVINGYIYYVDENGVVYTIVRKSDGIEVEAGFDFSNTTVAFAVVWKPQLVEDTVIVDFGLDVVIDVITNDAMAAGVVGVRLDAPADVTTDGTYTRDENNTLTTVDLSIDGLKIGTATVESLTSVRFSFDKTNGMQFNEPLVFYYEADVNYYTNNTLQTTSMYAKVTIIPATTIYYEESFVNFYNAGATAPSTPASGSVGNGYWQIVGATIGGTQDQDRPGDYSLLGDEIDHNNVYGYDGIYATSTTYSLGSAAKVTVDSAHTTLTTAPHAEFTFTGTGFDLISVTDNTSGKIAVRVTNTATNEVVATEYVNNYYGCKYVDGEFVVDESSEDCIYQVPVIKMDLNTHDTYKVEIYVSYNEYFDLTGDGQYTFVLDSIRVYDPAEGCNDTYIEDGEGYPHYLMVKEAILGRDDLENLSIDIEGTLNGSVFIDGMDSTTNAADYSNPGPNHEAYLAPGQSISFKLTANTTPIDVQLGAKLAYGDSVDVKIVVGEASKTLVIETATDLYYSIIDCLGEGWTTTDTITIANVSATDSNNLLSLTNIKATFESATTVSGSGGLKDVSATASTGTYSLMSARMVNLETVAEEEPVSISFLVDAEVIEDACAVMTALYAPEPEVFVPEALEYTVTNRFFGNSTVNVITSKDVASLTVNGVEAKKLSNSPLFSMLLKLIDGFESRFGVNVSANDFIIWSASTKRASSYDIVAYNADGLSSDPTVTDSSSSITKEDLDNYFNRSELYSVMEEMANQRFDPEQFETYINERFDGFREIITQTSEDVEYVIINGKIVDRYITETVIDTETGETTTKRVWITDAEDDVEDEEVEVNAYDEKGVGSESKWAERKFKFHFGWNNSNNNGNSNSASDNNKGNNGKGNSGKYGRM